MELLIQKSDRKTSTVQGNPKRYLYHKIDWKQKLIMILGYRGAGKTTLILQYLSTSTTKGIYLSLDDFYFESHRLVELIPALYEKGFRLFLLDEVHRYAYWSKDLKQLYDDFDDIHFVATGSSILDVSQGSADLSRRATVYHLHGLSFREFLSFYNNTVFAALSLEELISNHHIISSEILDIIDVRPLFEDYLRFGYFPFFLESTDTYHQKLQETLQLIIDTDIAPFEQLQHSTVRILKKLLFVLSESVPFTPNINKLAEKLETPRNTILKLLDILGQAQILKLLRSSTSGISYLQKPDKIYLQNTNFIFLFSPKMANLGNVRETFFINQLSAVHSVTSPKYGDFLVDNNYLFEIGGPNKTSEQIQGWPNAYLALDMDRGSDKRIPLWMFGLLY